MPAIAPHGTATSTGSWDGPANEARLKSDQDAAYYKRAFAWYDSAGDPKKKGTYKFPHHEVSGGGDIGAANVKACVAIIGALNGGRGGAKIPSADRAGVHAHAAKHLKDAGQNVPELKSESDYLKALAEFNAAPAAIERRFVEVADLAVRAADGDQPPMIVGHAAVFNQTADLGYFKERVAPGTFRQTIQEDDIRALWNHNEDHVLGRNRAGTLSLEEDSTGLAVRIMPPDTQMSRDLMVSMKRGDVSQMSFGFRRRSHIITQDADGNVTRTLTDVKLFDVSPVAFPAYTGTDASVRSAQLAELLEEFRRGPDNPRETAGSWEQDLDYRARELALVREI